MKAFTASLVLLAAASGVLGAKRPISDVKASSPDAQVPKKFIVELASGSSLPKRTDAHAALYAHLASRKVHYQVDKEFKANNVFTGASVTLADARDVAELLAHDGVLAVREARYFPRPEPVAMTVVRSPTDKAVPADTESTHKLTGVDKLHAEGFTGKGIKIGILDTGTDYTHPALGGAFGPGHKVAGGTDLVGDAYTGFNTPVPDNDPLDQCAGHGTHVAGIIGADPTNPYNISGVAYDSSIYSYRIFGCSGSTQDDIIIAALLDGYNQGVDILTLSLGGVDGWTESAGSVVASKIAARGKIVTIAAGNDGALGGWYTSSPGNGLDVISVSSLDNTVIATQNATVHGPAHAPIPYDSLTPLPVNGTKDVYATSLDPTVADDACSALPASTPDLSDKIVLIRRGTCAFVDKLGNAAKFGAKNFLVYNNVPGLQSVSFGNYTAAFISAEDGTFLANTLKAGTKVALSFPQDGAYFPFPDPNGGLISSFTSYGPSFDMRFKPAVAAPGGNILSTYIVKEGAYAVLSGTSMATPFLAGVSALLFQAKGKSVDVGLGARTLYETTAQPVSSAHTDGAPFQTLSQQGAGLVDAYKAVHSTTVVTPGEFLLNDTAYFVPTHHFKVANRGKKTQTFAIGHVAAGTALTIADGGITPVDGPVPLTAGGASASFSKTSVTVKPGSSAQLSVTFTAPKGLDAKRLPVYSGWVTITSDAESYQIPYLGVAAALKDQPIVDDTPAYFGVPIPAILDSQGNVQDGAANYTFTGKDFPSLLFRLVFGTPALAVELVDAATPFQPTLGAARAGKAKAGTSYASVKTLGALASYAYIPRNSDVPTENDYNELDFSTATFENGTAIAKGSYRVLLRALRVTGNAKKEADYDSWLSPVINYV